MKIKPTKTNFIVEIENKTFSIKPNVFLVEKAKHEYDICSDLLCWNGYTFEGIYAREEYKLIGLFLFHELYQDIKEEEDGFFVLRYKGVLWKKLR